MRIGIIAAMPGELKPLVRGWEPQHSGVRGLSVWKTLRDEHELIAVSGGMGSNAALRAFTAAEFLGALDMALSVGWAGALAPQMETGKCYLPCEVIDVQTGERFASSAGESALRLVTTPQVANPAEKKRLHESYGARLVDMEAATVARLAMMRQVPFYCFKAVSDSENAVLPDLNRFIDMQGQMRMASFVAHVAVRPQHWASLLELGRNSSIAARTLAESVNRFIAEQTRGSMPSNGVTKSE
jgi:adenosylhomocysteine nucleosidase